mgnify:FL=1
MGGRADYEERKQKRIERYRIVSQKAKEESEAIGNSSANRILRITPRSTNIGWTPL